jgi:GntR family transcriptional regulator
MNRLPNAIRGSNDLGVPPRQPELPSQRVELDLRRRLDADEWQPGEALPPVSALAERYGTSGATVAKVLRKLADEGLVRVVSRWGVFRA